VRHSLAEDVALRDLGEQPLRGMAAPERVFQIVGPGLPDSFPPPALHARPHNLPRERDHLVGRDRELAQATQILGRDEVGLLTLTGPGGVGKTRLAIQVGADLLDQFAGGVFFVGLASARDPQLVASAIAQALGVREIGGQSLTETLQDHLRNRQILLVLDNFEQVLPAASLVADMLVAAPHLKVLATSRAALQVRGERELPVPPLALPDGDGGVSVEALARFPATALFLERAQAIRPDLVVTDDGAAAVVEICRRLDGLPLAIELAAARCRLLSPEAVLGRLDRRLSLLTGGPRDLPARQQALRDTIAWSYDLLDGAEQRLFRRLAVFVGGFTLEAAEATCRDAGEPDGDIFDGVASLAAQSLLTQTERTGEARFAMLDTIREYGLELLEASGEAPSARGHHARHFLNLAERAGPAIWGADVRVWVDRLEAEHDNLRAALDWCLTADRETGLRLAASLWRFWERRGYLTEGRSWLDRLLAQSEALAETPSTAWAEALLGAGYLARDQGDLVTARDRFEASLVAFRAVGDTWGVGSSLRSLGLLAQSEGNLSRARALFEEAVVLFREVGHTVDIGWTLRNLGILAQMEGDYGRANAFFEQSLPILRQLGIKTGTGRVLGSLGILARIRGDYGRARSLLEESRDLLQEAGDKRGESLALGALATLAVATADRAAAHALVEQSLALGREMGDNACIARGLAMSGVLAARLGGQARGIRLIGAAMAIHPPVRSVLETDEGDDFDATLAEAEAAMGPEAFADAKEQGQRLKIDDAIALARAVDEATVHPRTPGATVVSQAATAPMSGLTERQVEVLRLVARGKSNREIAADLVLSEYTVMRHLSNIFNKIGVSSRAAAASFAVRTGLT